MGCQEISRQNGFSEAVFSMKHYVPLLEYTQDAHFVSYKGFDFLLHPLSPCIDKGDPHIYDWLYDYHPQWPDGYLNTARSDIGAYGGPGNINWLR